MKIEDQNLKYMMAKNSVEKVKRFYTHLVIYFIINSIITGFKVSNHLDSWDDFTNKFISIDVLSSWTVWGLVLIIHFLSITVFKGWEERKIKDLMQKELSQHKH